uniref:DSBA-like thioredoxin domain-containing protein n=1 Tax=Haptolina brevifila TaxID=156173 RepID=A0A7S2GRB6_9EUKA
MSALNRRHFELRESASIRATCLAAAAEAGIDITVAEAFLETDELEAEVWRSYGSTIRDAGIHAIPLFAFSVPAIDAQGGPFRTPGTDEAYVVRGSSSERSFLGLFELILRDTTAGTREYDAAAFPYRRDEWWSRRRLDLRSRYGRNVAS